ncbi:fungal hydrophobin [Coprinopsis marcescibilis]|uniref:Hydrophobin n=1 Tax=Coprinopsis marcescibilis TaxID=230819 RepID=A0A5C3KQN9_COPMA|nr:fungal hydrophobin [Coprinopsis marcescibilis]
MFARATAVLAAFTLFTAALAAPGGNTETEFEQCNGGKVQCCNSVQEANSLSAPMKALLGVLKVDVTQLTGQVGVTCTGVNVIGLGGPSCSNQQVCCNNNNFNGVVALGCTPINLAL